jgi:hypothetical protein
MDRRGQAQADSNGKAWPLRQGGDAMSAQPTYEQALQFMADAVLYQHIDLTGPWSGWRIRGQYLVTPEKERIPVRELVGLVIHYRGKFGHKRPSVTAASPAALNVIPFASAAVAQLQARKRVA